MRLSPRRPPEPPEAVNKATKLGPEAGGELEPETEGVTATEPEPEVPESGAPEAAALVDSGGPEPGFGALL